MISHLSAAFELIDRHSGGLTVLIALVAGVFALFQLGQANKIRKHEFEDIYVQRYWQIMDQLSADQKKAFYSGKYLTKELMADSKTRDIIWKYLELCEDEADLRQRNLITRQTWKVWHGGVKQAANRPPYSDLLEGLISELSHLPEADLPFKQLRAAAGRDHYDPRKRKHRPKG